MSFMFNPYPYDDPCAINRIPMSEEFQNTITRTTLETAGLIADDISEHLTKKQSCIIGIDGFISAPLTRLSGQLSILCSMKGIPVQTEQTDSLWMEEEKLHDKLLPYLPEDKAADPVLIYGRLYQEGFQGLMESKSIGDLKDTIKHFKENGTGVLIVSGNASLIDELRSLYDICLYIDMTQKRTILNIRSGLCGNLGIAERSTYTEMIRHSYYIDFEASFELRGNLIREEKINYYLAGDDPDHIKMIPIVQLKELFATMVTYPLRCRPVYIEGVWGGYYVKHLRQLPEQMKNCAWVFDLIPMEVSIVADLSGLQLEFPFYSFIQTIGPSLMGEKAAKKFKGYFPLRFNYDDTYHASGNMSIQVHPGAKYLRTNNGELGRQDESYYIVVSGQEAKTYCGFKEEASVEEFIEKAKLSEKKGTGFNHDDYVDSIPSVPGMQFMIPSGTIHASGRNQVILEIGSLTIGSYTYKMYDYQRRDLDGSLRPIHSYHGERVLERDRKTSWVKSNLIQKPKTLRMGEGYEEFIVGESDLLYFSLRNVRFDQRYKDCTDDRFQVLVLVEGESCLIRSLTDPTKYFIQSYLDMVIIPAGFGPYEVINQGPGSVIMHKTQLKDGFEYDQL